MSWLVVARRWITRMVMALFGACCVFLSAPADAQEKDRLEKAIDRALVFLETMQDADGAWTSAKQKNPAVSSLAMMAFLSAGHVPGEGIHRKALDRGIRWVLQQQQPSGIFATDGGHEMYHHGICTLMLAEMSGMTDAKLAKEIRPKLETAVKIILQGQRTQASIYKGGWRYRVESNDADLSITGWQILALRSARHLGCDVPADRLDLALQFLDKCRDFRSGAYTYLPGGKITSACTATGILVTQLRGKENTPSRETLQAASYLMQHLPQPGQEHFYYATYYTAQAIFQLRKNYWQLYRPQLHRALLDTQQVNGSWLTSEPQGPTYATAMAVLALTVEYQLLPIYQRLDENE